MAIAEDVDWKVRCEQLEKEKLTLNTAANTARHKLKELNEELQAKKNYIRILNDTIKKLTR